MEFAEHARGDSPRELRFSLFVRASAVSFILDGISAKLRDRSFSFFI